MAFKPVRTAGLLVVSSILLAPIVSGCRSVDSTLAGVGARDSRLVGNSATAPIQHAAPVTSGTLDAPVETSMQPMQMVPAADGSNARQQTVEDIRAKAAAGNAVNRPPQVGEIPQTAAEQLSPDDQQALKQEMSAEADAVQGELTDEELAAKQDSIRRLRQKAQSHYNQALKNIEN